MAGRIIRIIKRVMDTIDSSGPAGPEKGEENEKLEDAINYCRNSVSSDLDVRSRCAVSTK